LDQIRLQRAAPQGFNARLPQNHPRSNPPITEKMKKNKRTEDAVDAATVEIFRSRKKLMLETFLVAIATAASSLPPPNL